MSVTQGIAMNYTVVFENINSPITLITIYNEIDEQDTKPGSYFLIEPEL